MRVSTNSNINTYLTNLEGIQNRQNTAQAKLSTGKDMQSLSDDPKRMVSAKRLTELITRNNAYLDNIDSALGELNSANDQMSAMSDKLQSIRQYAIDATSAGNANNSYSIGVSVKGILDDLVKDANADYNGHFLFGGTKTTQTNPFELVKDTATANNPSGLKVVFHGNNHDRIINKDPHSQEIINTKASDMFGAGSTEMFDSIIELYNSLTYNSDGTERNSKSTFSSDDFNKVSSAQQKIASFNDELNNITARNGAKINRFQALSDQTVSESTRLKDFRSKDEDTDISKTSIDLTHEETALKYALEVGARLNQSSLFDFLR